MHSKRQTEAKAAAHRRLVDAWIAANPGRAINMAIVKRDAIKAAKITTGNC